MTPEETVTVKGSPVRTAQRFIEADLTPDERETFFRALPDDLATRFRTPILPTETVPMHVLNRFTEEAAKAKGEPLESFGRRLGHQAAADAVRGVYRFLALVMTPASILSKASTMWSTINNRGEMRVEQQSGSSAVLRLANFPSEPASCARITGWVERMAQLTGAKDVNVEHSRCVVGGATACEWKVTWR
jgi:uncharacterized protein (TIGR02265 family)